MTRRHDCQAVSNKQMRSLVWSDDGLTLVTTWGCRRCHSTWDTQFDPVKAEADRLNALRERVAEDVQQRRGSVA